MVVQVTLNEMSEIIEESEGNQQFTYDDVIVHKGNHPHKGDYILINTLSGNCILIN